MKPVHLSTLPPGPYLAAVAHSLHLNGYTVDFKMPKKRNSTLIVLSKYQKI